MLAFLVSSMTLVLADTATPDAKAILTKASNAFQSLKSYQFEGKSVSETTIGGKTSRTEVGYVVAFEAPNKLRLEYRYPTAGNWLRVSDGQYMLVRRTITKESRREPVTDRTIETLSSSPIYAFQTLSDTAEQPLLKGSETIEVGGHPVDCQVIQFATHQRQLMPGESSGTSTVWVDKQTGLVLREEIQTSATSGNSVSEGKRTITVDSFNVNSDLANDLFSTEPAGHQRESASKHK